MDGITQTFVIVGIAVFAITLFVLFVFPVEVYERAKNSPRLRDFAKGMFAQTVVSMYRIKVNGLAAEGSDWGHLIWFNVATAIVVSLLVTFGLYIIFIVVASIVLIGLLMVGLGSLGK